MTIALVILLAVFVIFLLIVIAAGFRIIRPYQRGIVEMLGRYQKTVDPGIQIIIPFVQSIRVVDMREQVVDVPPQEVITSDNVVVSVDAVIYYEPSDPRNLVYNVANFLLAITKLAQTNLRNLIGDLELDAALTSRDKINLELRQILDDATDKWGVRVARVEIQRIDPPPDVMAAMHEQMKAERNRRAVVTQASGQREAAIAAAEGAQQAAILEAEGIKQRQILEAQGEADAIKAVADAEAYRQRVVADGQALAIKSVYTAIHEGDPTPDLIAIKYLEALQNMADGQATKIFLPADTSGVMASIGAIGELFGEGAKGNGSTPTG
jgi:regulator of protease activity HflC (stomatin/prohibitin superfamily)